MNSLEQLLEFLIRLQNAKIKFNLDCVRDSIMVIVPTPSKYYEIEFFADGHIEGQTFGLPSAVARMTLEEISEAVIRRSERPTLSEAYVIAQISAATPRETTPQAD